MRKSVTALRANDIILKMLRDINAGEDEVVGKIRTEKYKQLNFCPNEKNKKKIHYII